MFEPEKKPGYWQKRADRDIGSVVKCLDKYEEKQGKINEEIAAVQAALEEAKKEGQGAPSHIQRQLFTKCKRFEDMIENDIGLLEQYDVTIYILGELNEMLRVNYDQEHFFKIVRIVPQRTIMRMARDPRKLEQLQELVISLLKQFGDSRTRAELVREAMERKKKEVEYATVSKNNMIHGGKSKEEVRKEKDAEIDAYFATPVEAKVPAPLEAEDVSTASKPNKA